MDVTISAGFSGRPYDLRMRIYTIENNVGGNYSRYRGDRYGYSRSGYGSYANNSYTVDSWIAGYYAGGAYSLPFAPGDYAGKTIGFGSYDTGGVGHDGNGNVWFTSRIRMQNASVFGTADTGDVGMNGDFLPRPPQAPTPVGVDEVTPVSLRYRFSGNWDGGSPITSWQVQIATDAGFTQNVETVNSSGTTTFSGRTPNTTYYLRSRGNNAYWNGPWSATTVQSTLPANAPGMAVSPSLSGQSATVTLSPPGGATGVTEYNIEYRLLGSGSATATTTTSTSKTINGLTPGSTYEWRSNAEFGSYTTPWTAWTGVIQPNPNTNPGDYFDGSTAPRGDLTFSWGSTVNNSISNANGVQALGWAVFASSATLRLQRVTGGRSGMYAARMLVITDAGAVGQRIGMNGSTLAHRAEVEEGATYVGSIFVKPSRAQRLAAQIAFFDAAGAVVGTATVGTAELVTSTATWTRLAVSAVVPPTAETATVVAIDVSGTGHVPWKSGEWLDADDVMISLSSLFDWFSGDTTDVPGYDFAWLGAANASASARYETEVVLSDPLADPDCPPQPTPPALPTIPSDCIDETGTWRRYPLTIPASEVRMWSSSLPTLILSTDGTAERQVRIRYYPNPANLAPEVIAGTVPFEAEQILTYIPPETVLTLDAVTQQVTAVVDDGAPLPADHLLYGTGGTPATWPELRCGIGYVVTLDVPLDAPAGNLKSRVIITQRM